MDQIETLRICLFSIYVHTYHMLHLYILVAGQHSQVNKGVVSNAAESGLKV